MTPTQEELVGTGANPPVPTRHLTVDQAGAAIALLVLGGYVGEGDSHNRMFVARSDVYAAYQENVNALASAERVQQLVDGPA